MLNLSPPRRPVVECNSGGGWKHVQTRYRKTVSSDKTDDIKFKLLANSSAISALSRQQADSDSRNYYNSQLN